MTYGEKDTYDALLTKFANICEENNLIYKVNTKSYPFSVTVTPDQSMDAQISMLDNESGYNGKDAKLVLFFPDGVLQYKFSDDFTLSEALMTKLKNSVTKIYQQWCKICFRDGIEKQRFVEKAVDDVENDGMDVPEDTDVSEDSADTAQPETEPEYAEL